jgi:hypothetical protein
MEGDMNRVILAGCRRLPGIALLCAVVAAAPALAQQWTEPKFEPQVGSAWSVVSMTDSEKNGPNGPLVTQQVRTRTEFTVDEKLPTGFRISYVTREIKIEGNAPGGKIAETAFAAMKDIVIRGRTDATGKPVVVENLDEVKANMRGVIARLSQAYEKNPKVADLMRQILSGLLDVDATRAAETYMDDMSLLAAGQNTGILPGAVKRQDETVESPLGGFIKTSLETRLESFDAGAGKVRYIRKRAFDPESMKAVTLALTEKMMAAGNGKPLPPAVLEQLKDISFSVENETVISVEGGMTRTIDDRSFTSARLMGQTMRKTEKKTVAVSRIK